MNPRRLAVLMVAALAVITFAFWLSTQRYLPRDPAFAARALPELRGSLDEITGVRIVGAGNVPLVTLDRPDGRWRVAERGYPADSKRVRALLLALGDLQVVEPKTREPANYARLGVEDVRRPDAQGVRLDLRGLDAPLALIVGREADPATGYVRLDGAPASLLVRPRLDVPRDPRAWLARTVVDVAPERIQSFEIERAGMRAWRGAKDGRADPHFTAAGLPDGRELDRPDAIDALANVLAAFEIDDVVAAGRVEGAASPDESRATFRTYDGLVVTVLGRAYEDRLLVRFDVAFDPAQASRFPPGAGDDAPGTEQVRAEAERLGTLTRGWWYVVSADRYDRTFRAPDAFLRPRGTP